MRAEGYPPRAVVYAGAMTNAPKQILDFDVPSSNGCGQILVSLFHSLRGAVSLATRCCIDLLINQHPMGGAPRSARATKGGKARAAPRAVAGAGVVARAEFP